MRKICILLLALILAVSSTGASAQTGATYITASEADLNNPHDLKLSPDGRYLFVADVNNDRIAVLDPETLAFVGAWGNSDGESGNHDIDFDSQGRAYVADTGNKRITIYDMEGPTGRYSGELASPKTVKPEGVLVHPDGRIYVASAGSNNLVVYKNGDIVNERAGFSAPHDLEFDKNGDIWLADSNNNQMLLLSPDLSVIKKTYGGSPYNFDGVRYQDVLDNGTLIAADKNNHAVKFIDVEGKLLFTIGGEAGLGRNRFRTPEGVEVHGNTVWLADSGNDRIVKYQLLGINPPSTPTEPAASAIPSTAVLLDDGETDAKH